MGAINFSFFLLIFISLGGGVGGGGGKREGPLVNFFFSFNIIENINLYQILFCQKYAFK